MDEIEAGFEAIKKRVQAAEEEKDALSEKVRKHDAELLGKMVKSSLPIIKLVGLNMLMSGKHDTKGEIFDPRYYPEKMIILGKTDPSPFRPDDPAKKITDQFCVVSEDGKIYELMYSSDVNATDSYRNTIDARTALQVYGYDVMFMLYSAMHDYLKSEEDLIDALNKVIGYVFARKA